MIPPRAALLVLLPLALAACLGPRGRAPTTPAPEPRYDETREVACHNCFEHQYLKSFAGAIDHTSSVEIDFFDTPNALPMGGLPHAWFVRHVPKGRNDNNCTTSSEQTTGDLAACLEDVLQWLKRDPAGPVVTVFLDKKQNWGSHREPADLDALVTRIIPPARIFTPGELARRAESTPREAAARHGWPPTDSLRGRVVFVLTGGGLLPSAGHNRVQARYVRELGDKAVFFVAPVLKDSAEVAGIPPKFDRETAPWVVFYNMPHDDWSRALASNIRRRGQMLRVWWSRDRDDDDVCGLMRAGASRVARRRIDPLPACEPATDATHNGTD